mmetsp:Transcript_15921/g.27516  ORF Transcript_15921/g.27516 Transcript_15921/m.27516 type:complete len:85 (+) Transcript_15921:806-1060(+)
MDNSTNSRLPIEAVEEWTAQAQAHRRRGDMYLSWRGTQLFPGALRRWAGFGIGSGTSSGPRWFLLGRFDPIVCNGFGPPSNSPR